MATSTDAPRPSTLSPARSNTLRAIAVALTIASAIVLSPYVPWLVLAGWTAALATPWVDRLAPRRDRRRTAAAMVTLAILVIAAGPAIATGAAMWADARELLREARATGTGRAALELVISEQQAPHDPLRLVSSPEALVAWLRSSGPEAWSVATDVVGAAGQIALGLVVFLAGTYVGLVEGRRAFAWAVAHLPLARRDVRRLADAFVETGRGLLVGLGLTGLVQAVLAGGAYAVIGIERALVLAFLTFFASFLPTIGTGLVWGPVVIGLWITGRRGEAIGMLAWNALVVSTIDNLLRPVLARVGKVDMHVLLLLVSMVGGLVALGPWGILLGPLVVRLLIEAMRIAMPSAPS
ncbi:AI-2E family transporter [Sandaracinus amylolyticus]|uniref:Putative membrane protein n=1 Tax=Sandaracinus amylolyticus TaxID=927083 RepID=A0A0F6SEF3_9BACT|nr:AI-2E family transporter [Sandaracinus amylolyticus]AKF05094.1 Putative membrane protein [Sandaracinus amylolyticus]